MGFFSDLGGSMFHSNRDPARAARRAYEANIKKAAGYLTPYEEWGRGAMEPYQEWFEQFKNPTEYYNNLMSQYQESPYAQYMQGQSEKAAQNAASASGLSGSTPLMQDMQNRAQQISSQDFGNWFGDVMGLNKMYGGGLESQLGYGQNAANALANLYSGSAGQMGDYAGAAKAGSYADAMGTAMNAIKFAGLFI